MKIIFLVIWVCLFAHKLQASDHEKVFVDLNDYSFYLPSSAFHPLSTEDTFLKSFFTQGLINQLKDHFGEDIQIKNVENRRLRIKIDSEHLVDLEKILSKDFLTQSFDREVRFFPTIDDPVIPNDPLFSDQWGLLEEVTNFQQAWSITQGSEDIVVAIIDTGVTDHSDLNVRLLNGVTFLDAGDTRIHGAQDTGDFVEADECYTDSPARNSSWHGTHVAGIVGAVTDNSIGVSGGDWNARILPIRTLGKCGGYTSDIADGIRWAAGGDVVGFPSLNQNPADIINLSLGGQTACQNSLQQAIDYAVSRGVLVVASSGNDNLNLDLEDFSPANCQNVITVGAVNRDLDRTSYSNYGASVLLSAPGGEGAEGIYSTYNNGPEGPTTESYQSLNGTSMAAPFVSAALSLMKSINKNLNYEQAVEILTDEENVTSMSVSQCTVGGCGAGLLNAYKALKSMSVIDSIELTIMGESVIEANGTDTTTLRALAKNVVGLSLADKTLTLVIPSNGGSSILETTTNSEGEAFWELTASEVANLYFYKVEGEGVESNYVGVRFSELPVTSIVLSVDDSGVSFLANGSEVIDFEALVTNEIGNPVEGRSLSLLIEEDGGEVINPQMTNSSGLATWSLTVPSVAGNFHYQAQLEEPMQNESELISNEIDLTFFLPDLDRVFIEVEGPLFVSSADFSMTELAARVVDSGGFGISNREIELQYARVGENFDPDQTYLEPKLSDIDGYARWLVISDLEPGSYKFRAISEEIASSSVSIGFSDSFQSEFEDPPPRERHNDFSQREPDEEPAPGGCSVISFLSSNQLEGGEFGEKFAYSRIGSFAFFLRFFLMGLFISFPSLIISRFENKKEKY